MIFQNNFVRRQLLWNFYVCPLKTHPVCQPKHAAVSIRFIYQTPVRSAHVTIFPTGSWVTCRPGHLRIFWTFGHYSPTLNCSATVTCLPDVRNTGGIDSVDPLRFINYQIILLTTQYTAYPTPKPNGSMAHGRHKGVSLNFQAKIPTAKRPNIMPMILGSIWLYPSLSNLTKNNVESHLTLTSAIWMHVFQACKIIC